MVTLQFEGFKIVIVHGFNVFDGGKKSIDKLAPYLKEKYPGAEIDKDSTDYKHGLIKVRFFSGPTVKRISEALHDADLVIGHSNGCNYTMKAVKRYVRNKYLHIINISPALNRKQRLRKLVFHKMDTFHSEGDWVVKLSTWLPFHPWGRAGAKGIKTTDPRHDNHAMKDPGHSSWFGELSIESFCTKKLFPVIDANLIKRGIL